MNHVANMTGLEIDNEFHQDILHKTVRITAWVQVLVPLILGVLGLWWFIRRRRVKK